MFEPAKYSTFRFTERSLSGREVRLGYALDDEHHFVEELTLPVDAPRGRRRAARSPALGRGRELLQDGRAARDRATRPASPVPPPPRTSRRCTPRAWASSRSSTRSTCRGRASPAQPREAHARPKTSRVLVPVGGGKDSIVALEIVRRSGLDFSLFTVRDQPPMARTAEVARRAAPARRPPAAAGAAALARRRAQRPHPDHGDHLVHRAADGGAERLRRGGAGQRALGLAGQRQLRRHRGQPPVLQERARRGAAARARRPRRPARSTSSRSCARPRSSRSPAASPRYTDYHRAFTSCNRVFRLDPELRFQSWCADCDKCRFVFLVLAPFMEPAAMEAIFGKAMLDDPEQFPGFALLTATGGHKPFECVGEEEESAAAITLLAQDPRWRDREVVRRLVEQVPATSPGAALRAQRRARRAGRADRRRACASRRLTG